MLFSSFHNAPNDEEFQKETIRRVNLLSTADCLRADKSCMAHGLEVRVPFLDKQFLQLAMGIAPKHKRPMFESTKSEKPVEKWLLRKAFEREVERNNGGITIHNIFLLQEDPFLPDDILWRQKEQFSDGVGYGWIDQLKDFCESQITDEEVLF